MTARRICGMRRPSLRVLSPCECERNQTSDLLMRDCSISVKSTEGISEIWFCEPFPRRGFLRFRVRVRFTSGSEFTRSYSETPLWSKSGFDGCCELRACSTMDGVTSLMHGNDSMSLCKKISGIFWHAPNVTAIRVKGALCSY